MLQKGFMMKNNESSGKKTYGNDIGLRVHRELGSAYGSTTFMKVKADMFHCGILNIDFIDKTETVEAQKSIGTYLKVVEANNLFSMVLNDELFKRLALSCIDTLKKGNQYADTLIAYQGGTNGTCWILEIFAGSKMVNVIKAAGEPYKLTAEMLLQCKMKGNVMFRAKKGQGQTTNTGGVSMRSGAKQKSIQVPVGCDNLCAIAREVTDDWRLFKETAYMRGYFTAEGETPKYDVSTGLQGSSNYEDDTPPADDPPPAPEKKTPSTPDVSQQKANDGYSSELEAAKREYLEAANSNPEEIINLFRGPYSYLSNMYACPVEIDGRSFSSAEAAYQSAKCVRDEDKDSLSKIAKGADAKEYGEKVSQINDLWDEVRDEVVVRAVYAKFTQNPKLAEKLLSTGDAKMVEGNFGCDNHLGKCACKKCARIDSPNVLGRSLFFVRNCIRDGLDFEKYVGEFLNDIQNNHDGKGAA